MKIKKTLIGKKFYVIDDFGKSYGPFKNVEEISDLLHKIKSKIILEYARKVSGFEGQNIYSGKPKYINQIGYIVKDEKTGLLLGHKSDKGILLDIKVPCIYDKVYPIMSEHIIELGEIGTSKYNNEIYDDFEGIESYGVKQDGKWGILNQYGIIIVPCKYDKIVYKNGVFIVKEGRKCGVLNLEGEEIVQCKFDEIVNVDNLFVVKKDQKYGLLNRMGEPLVECKYDSIVLDNDIFIVEYGEKFGILNKMGKETVECKYDRIINDNDNGVYIVEDSKKYGILDKMGNEIIQCKYDRICVNTYDNKNVFFVNDNKKCGIIDADGNEVINCRYDKIIHSAGMYYYMYIVKEGQKYGVLREDGKQLIPCSYDEIEIDGFKGAFVRNGENWGNIDIDDVTGFEILPCEYTKEDAYELIKCFRRSYDEEFDRLFKYYVEDIKNVQDFICLKNYLNNRVKIYIGRAISKRNIDRAVADLKKKLEYIAGKIEFLSQKEKVKKESIGKIDEFNTGLFPDDTK